MLFKRVYLSVLVLSSFYGTLSVADVRLPNLSGEAGYVAYRDGNEFLLKRCPDGTVMPVRDCASGTIISHADAETFFMHWASRNGITNVDQLPLSQKFQGGSDVTYSNQEQQYEYVMKLFIDQYECTATCSYDSYFDNEPAHHFKIPHFRRIDTMIPANLKWAYESLVELDCTDFDNPHVTRYPQYTSFHVRNCRLERNTPFCSPVYFNANRSIH